MIKDINLYRMIFIRYPGFVQPYKSEAWSEMIELADSGYPPAGNI